MLEYISEHYAINRQYDLQVIFKEMNSKNEMLSLEDIKLKLKKN